MTDVRELLERGADVHPGLPQVERAVRAARVARRRRAALIAGVAAAVLVTAGGVSTVVRPPADPPSVVGAPAGQPLPVPGGPLVGRTTYSTAGAGLPWRLTAPDGAWTVAAREDGWVSLHLGRQRLNLQRWTGVFDPGADPAAPEDVEPLPEDLYSWITTHPRLTVTSSERVVVAGERWRAVDVTVDRALRLGPPECTGNPCALLGTVGTEHVELLSSEDGRIYLPETDSDGLVIVAAVPTGRDQTRIEALIASLSKE